MDILVASLGRHMECVLNCSNFCDIMTCTLTPPPPPSLILSGAPALEPLGQPALAGRTHANTHEHAVPTLAPLPPTTQTPSCYQNEQLMLVKKSCKTGTCPEMLALGTDSVLLCYLQAFDELLLLQRGGSTLYCGPLGDGCKKLIDYFQQLGADEISPGYNPATWMLENTTASMEEKKDVNFAEAFQDSDLQRCGPSPAGFASYSLLRCVDGHGCMCKSVSCVVGGMSQGPHGHPPALWKGVWKAYWPTHLLIWPIKTLH